MAEFINTIDVLGDDAVINSIIDRSIIEFADNTIADGKLGLAAFAGCTDLTTVDFPEVTSIGVSGRDNPGPFMYCTSLRNMNFPKVTYIGNHAFTGCTSFESIDFPEVTSIGTLNGYCYGPFNECTNLKNINLPKVTSLGARAFGNCTSLETVDFPLVTTAGVNTFENNTALESASFPRLTKIDSRMFYNCTKLKTVYCPEATEIANNAFDNCPLTGAKFPKVTKMVHIPTADTHITDENFPVLTTFDSITGGNLTHIKLSKVTTITGRLGMWVGKLTYLDFASLTSFSNTGTLGHGSNISTIVLRNTSAVCTLAGGFSFCPVASGTGHIYVPRALIENYKAATNWSTYASQFRIIEDYTVDGTITGDLDESKI